MRNSLSYGPSGVKTIEGVPRKVGSLVCTNKSSGGDRIGFGYWVAGRTDLEGRYLPEPAPGVPPQLLRPWRAAQLFGSQDLLRLGSHTLPALWAAVGSGDCDLSQKLIELLAQDFTSPRAFVEARDRVRSAYPGPVDFGMMLYKALELKVAALDLSDILAAVDAGHLERLPVIDELLGIHPLPVRT